MYMQWTVRQIDSGQTAGLCGCLVLDLNKYGLFACFVYEQVLKNDIWFHGLIIAMCRKNILHYKNLFCMPVTFEIMFSRAVCMQ